MRRLALLGVLLASPLAGCRGEYGVRCENPERYADSREIPPVQVPDDLSVPSQNEALRIPSAGQLPLPRPPSARGPCLESPPSYFEDGALAGEETRGAEQEPAETEARAGGAR